MSVLHGIKTFEALRSAATEVKFRGVRLYVADLKDVINSKRSWPAEGRRGTRYSEKTLREEEHKNQVNRKEEGKAKE